MDELLLEDIQLESMEILSLEERDMDEIIRENSHLLLDAEMDLEELLCESGLEFLEEGLMSNLGKKIKELWAKLKAYIKKFIDWVVSLIKKDKSASKDASNSGSKDDSNSGSKDDSKTTGTKKSDNNVKNHRGYYIEIPKPPSTGNIRLFNAKGTENLIETRFFSFVSNGFKKQIADGSIDIQDAIKEVREIAEVCKKDLSKFWYNGNVSEVIEEKNGTWYYHNVNSDFEDLLRDLNDNVEYIEKELSTFNPDEQEDPEFARKFFPLLQAVVSAIQSVIAEYQKIFKEDKANRMAAIREDLKANGNRRGF